MGGIAGTYRLDGGPADEHLNAMLDAIAHRGPERVGWRAGAVALGRRAAQSAALPENEGRGLAIVADARIDNPRELREALGGGPRADVSNAELILAAYEQWGERCPERLTGDFAFAVWDARLATLFCARDPFGVRPLFFHRSREAFCFASEIKSLLRLPRVARTLDEAWLAAYVAAVPEPLEGATAFEGVKRLPAGHSVSVSPSGVRQRRYFSLDPVDELPPRSNAEYAEQFRDLFTEAVRSRLRSEAAVGSMLSGGLDSSSVVAVARDLGAGDGALPTFSVAFPATPQCDERPYIDAVIDQGGLRPSLLNGDAISPMIEIDRLLDLVDEPFFGPSVYLQWNTYAVARQAGIDTMLDGVGGDQVVSYGLFLRLDELARRGRWLALAREVACTSRRLGRSPLRLVRDHMVPGLAPPALRKLRHVVHGERGPHWSAGTLISPEFAARVEDRLLDECPALCQTPPRTAREGHRRDLYRALPREPLERIAAAHGVEARYPFFDRRLVEFCLALPTEQKGSRGWNRLIVRRALADLLPERVLTRTWKANPVPSLSRNLLGMERPLLDDAVHHPPAELARYVDVGRLRAAWGRFSSRPPDHYAAHPASIASWRDAAETWRAAILALWLRRQG